jgi:hypothetical protein
MGTTVNTSTVSQLTEGLVDTMKSQDLEVACGCASESVANMARGAAMSAGGTAVA